MSFFSLPIFVVMVTRRLLASRMPCITITTEILISQLAFVPKLWNILAGDVQK